MGKEKGNCNCENVIIHTQMLLNMKEHKKHYNECLVVVVHMLYVFFVIPQVPQWIIT